MRRRIEAVIKKKLQESSGEIVFASLFGSYRRGDYDVFSDVDVFVVCADGDEKPFISRELKSLEHDLNRSVHINLFTRREFEDRLRLHDYLTLSIIEDSSFIFGSKEFFVKAKQNALKGHPDERSIRFNRDRGFETLKRVYSNFSKLDSSGFNPHKDLLNYVLKGLNDYRLGLGYLYTSVQMHSSGRSISPACLEQTGFGSSLKDIAYLEKIIKRRSIDYSTLREITSEIKDKSLRILCPVETRLEDQSFLLNLPRVKTLLKRT